MLKIIDNVDYNKLEKHLKKLNIMNGDECIYSNVYCCIDGDDEEFIENNCIDDYNVQFFINEDNEIDYCCYPETRNEDIILEKIYDLTKDNLLISV